MPVPPAPTQAGIRGDAGFGYQPVLHELEDRRAHYAVVARLTVPLKRRFAGLHYERANARWQLAETEYRALGWPHPSARSRTSAQTESRADRSGHHEWT